MALPRRQRSRQSELFPRSMRSVIPIARNHRLVQMTDEIDWIAPLELVSRPGAATSRATPGVRHIFER